MNKSVSLALVTTAALLISALFTPASSQKQSKPQEESKLAAAKGQVAPAKKVHRVVIQISQNDPAVMNVALNNAENLTTYYGEKGEPVEIELVAYGPGLHMVRSDTSPVKARIATVGALKQVTVSGCGNTMRSQGKQEEKNLSLVSEARVVPSGIVRIAELQEQGWTYIRP
jgi:intracellular sulfur oxidation DsrE/DsrF family protein